MTNMEKKLLKQFRIRSPIGKDQYLSVQFLEKLGFVKIDKDYVNTIEGVIIYYAKITEKGKIYLDSLSFINSFPLLKKLLKR